MLRTSINLKAIRFVHTYMQPSAHATTLNFDEVSFKEHGVSVLPSSKIISSLCVCMTGFATARVNVCDRQYQRYIHSILSPSVCQMETNNSISGTTRPKMCFRAPFGKFGLFEKIGRY